MLRTLVYAVGALAVGALSGMAYGNLGKGQALLDPPTPAETQVSIAEPVANTALASVKSESNESEPVPAAIVRSEGSATETSAAFRAEPAKPATKPRQAPRLILGIGW